MAVNPLLKGVRDELVRRSSAFSRVECDFGAAKGKFLTDSALLQGETFFLGIEGLPSRVVRANRKITRLALANAAVWRGWGVESLELLVPESFLDVLHVSFPDPWPKRRHWGRRLVNTEFLRIAASRLKPAGVLRLMTDHPGYFQAMKEALAAHGGWREMPWEDGMKRPVTEFETIFLAKGDPIGRVAVRREGAHPL
jgi:tRNA (guanine-N7-)-methyltransferase